MEHWLNLNYIDKSRQTGYRIQHFKGLNLRKTHGIGLPMQQERTNQLLGVINRKTICKNIVCFAKRKQ